MIQYQYATDESGNIVTAEELAGKKIQEKYHCVGCQNELIARVNGKIRRPHFAHKVQVECSDETYLHRLGKSVFVETYKQCLKNQTPFILELTHSKRCNKYYPLLLKDCIIGVIKKEYDLTNYYQEILVETRESQFIPDVILVNKSNPKNNIFIEIAVTHFLTEEKAKSENRIIEIPLKSEEDIDFIKTAKVTEDNAKFLGFNQFSDTATDSECKCANEKYYCFYIYKNGEAFLDYSDLRSLLKHEASYINLIKEEELEEDYGDEIFITETLLFIKQIHLATSKNVLIKNCHLCRYHAINFKYKCEYDNTTGLIYDSFFIRKHNSRDYDIFCKTYKIQCYSNRALNCERYRRRKYD